MPGQRVGTGIGHTSCDVRFPCGFSADLADSLQTEVLPWVPACHYGHSCATN
jgi:hypothetical protein